jgi:hypothetical protein
MNDLPPEQRIAALMALPTAADLRARRVLSTPPPKRSAAIAASLLIKDDAPRSRKRASPVSSASSSVEASPKKEVPVPVPACGTCWLARQERRAS